MEKRFLGEHVKECKSAGKGSADSIWQRTAVMGGAL